MNLSILAKTVLLVVSVSCVASAQLTPTSIRYSAQYQGGLGGGDVDPSPYDPGPYDPQPGYGQRETRSIFLQRNVTNERLNLRVMAGLNNNYNGWEVLSIRGNTRPNNPGRTIVQLIADGRIIATQANPGAQIYLTPQIRAILGNGVRILELSVNGSTYIEGLQIDLMRPNQGPPLPPQPPQPPYPPQPPEPPPYPNPPGQQQISVPIYIHRALYGNDRVDLTQYIDLRRYLGYAVDQVILQATPANQAAVNVLINGNNMGQAGFRGNFSQLQTVWLSQHPVIGRGADSIVLYSSGQMLIERVTLVLSR